MPQIVNSTDSSWAAQSRISSSDGSDFSISFTQGEEPSYSIGDVEFYGTIRFDTDDILDALRMADEGRRPSRLSIRRKLKRNKLRQTMPENPIGTWAFNQYSEQYSVLDAAGVLAGENGDSGGAESLLASLFDRAIEGMGERVGSNPNYARAFNDETTQWPHEVRMRLAGYLLQVNPEWLGEDERFAEELERFAENGGYHPGGENGPIPDDFDEQFDEMPEDPFERQDYSDEMATAYCVVWANGENPEEIDFEEVSNVDDFRWWVEKTGDLDDSLRAHHFGRDVPIEVVRHALPPEEWDELEPDLEENEYECVQCMNVFYSVETPNGLKSASRSGETREGLPLRLGEEDNPFIYFGSREDHLCPECADTIIGDEDWPTTFFVGESGNVAAAYSVSGIAVDYGAAFPESGFSPVPQLDSATQDAVVSYYDSGNVTFGDREDSLSFSASEGPANHEDVFEAIETVTGQPERIEGTFTGPLVISDGRPEPAFYVPGNRPDVVVETKEFLKNPTNV